MSTQLLKKIFCCGILLISQSSFANPFDQSFYVSINGGVMQGMFDTQYNDVTDIIPQNIAQTLFQHGYTGGIAFGYSKLYCRQYLFGIELSRNFNSNNANYASGASTTAFSDNIRIRSSLDLVFNPGFLLTDSVVLYGKVGISFANIVNRVISPVGFLPVSTTFSSTRNLAGLALGIGIKKMVSADVAIFAEYNFHDYGKTNMQNFQNFTATYTHAVHVYSQNVVIGLSYLFQ